MLISIYCKELVCVIMEVTKCLDLLAARLTPMGTGGLAPVLRLAGFRSGSAGKESACHAGVQGLIPGSGRSPGGGNGNPRQYSCLQNPTGRGESMESQRVRHDWVTELSLKASRRQTQKKQRFKSESEVRKRLSLRGRSSGRRGPLSLTLCGLAGLSAHRMRLTHIREYNPFDSVFYSDVHFPQKHPHRHTQNSVWPNVWAPRADTWD